MYFVIDPGLSSGWSIWDKKWNLLKFGIVSGRGEDWREKMESVSKRLRIISRKYKATKTYIEQPRVFQGEFGSMVARRGDVVKLSMIVGQIAGRVGTPVEYVEIYDWKGNLPKDIVEKRVRRLLPGVKARSHEVDSIGMGLFLKGVF